MNVTRRGSPCKTLIVLMRCCGMISAPSLYVVTLSVGQNFTSGLRANKHSLDRL